MEFIYINSWFYDKKWIYYELLKIKDQKILEMNTSEEIFKLTRLRFSGSGVGTGFLWKPKPIPNFCSVSVTVFSGVGSVKPILSVMNFFS